MLIREVVFVDENKDRPRWVLVPDRIAMRFTLIFLSLAILTDGIFVALLIGRRVRTK